MPSFFRCHVSEGSRKQQVKKHKKENCRIRAVLFGRSLIESAAAIFTGNILVGCCFQHMKFPVSFVGNEEENQSSSFVQIRSVSRRLRRVHRQLQCLCFQIVADFYLLLQSFLAFLAHIVSEQEHQFPDLLRR